MIIGYRPKDKNNMAQIYICAKWFFFQTVLPDSHSAVTRGTFSETRTGSDVCDPLIGRCGFC